MKNISYSELAINAMHRASKKAIEKAARLNLKIPVWKNNEIIFINAKDKLQTDHSSKN